MSSSSEGWAARSGGGGGGSAAVVRRVATTIAPTGIASTYSGNLREIGRIYRNRAEDLLRIARRRVVASYYRYIDGGIEGWAALPSPKPARIVFLLGTEKAILLGLRWTVGGCRFRETTLMG